MIAGIFVVFLFTPFAGDAVKPITGTLKKIFDIGFCGFVVNLLVMIVVSRFTQPLDPERVARFRQDLLPDPKSDS